MPKTSSELVRHALNGPTMGTSWQVTFHASPGLDPGPVRRALQAAVDEVDAQMSTWKPDSDLMRLNRTPPGKWVMLPTRLAEVLRLGLVVGRASGGAFDIGMGDAVRAWGFGPEAPEAGAIRAAMSNRRQPAHEVLELDGLLLRKRAPIVLDLNGIAKGYGVDRLNEILREHGITASLSGIDGEMRGQVCALMATPGWWRSGPPTPTAARAFDPGAGECRRRHLGRLSPPDHGRGPQPVAHHGSSAWRAAACATRLGDSRCPHLRRSRCLDDGADGRGRGRGLRAGAATRAGGAVSDPRAGWYPNLCRRPIVRRWTSPSQHRHDAGQGSGFAGYSY